MDRHYKTGSGSVVAIKGHPLHPFIIPIPIGLLVGALVADIVYPFTGDPFWARGAYWLLLGGLISGVVAGATGLVELLGIDRARRLPIAWVHGLGNLAGLIVVAVNFYIRTGDVTGAVLPVELTLSAVTVLALLVTGWLGGEMSYRHAIGVERGVGAGEPLP